jgi:hypothetical protein
MKASVARRIGSCFEEVTSWGLTHGSERRTLRGCGWQPHRAGRKRIGELLGAGYPLPHHGRGCAASDRAQ